MIQGMHPDDADDQFLGEIRKEWRLDARSFPEFTIDFFLAGLHHVEFWCIMLYTVIYDK